MKISTEKYIVLSSGMVHSFGMKPMKFRLSDEPLFDVIFKVIFNDAEPAIKFERTGDSEITFLYTNPNLLDFGFSDPVKIGLIDGKNTYVVFRVTIHGENKSYSLNYSFFVEDDSL